MNRLVRQKEFALKQKKVMGPFMQSIMIRDLHAKIGYLNKNELKKAKLNLLSDEIAFSLQQ